jgi:hypothetical protein
LLPDIPASTRPDWVALSHASDIVSASVLSCQLARHVAGAVGVTAFVVIDRTIWSSWLTR